MKTHPAVCVVDDDEAVRESLGYLLEGEGYEVRRYGSAEEFLASDAPACACIITDVRMPGVDGVSMMRVLNQRGLRAPVIFMTGHGDVPLAVTAMKQGAADFLQKPFSDDTILNAIRSAMARPAEGGGGAAAESARRSLAELSPRERQVLERLVNGDANKVIAQDLGISARTVEIYRANVMAKMEADSFAMLVRLAIAGGLGGEAPR